MTYSLSRTVTAVFLFTAVFYLVLVSFIQYPVNTFLKPIPIACLIIGVLQINMVRWAKIVLVLALMFSLSGDIVLTLPVALTLELGIGCFLLAHCCYIALFFSSFEYRASHLLYSLPVLIFMVCIAYMMIPYLGAFLVPVMIYLCILMLMVFSAFQVKREWITIISGALFFLISDLTLALNLFIYPSMDVRVLIMFTYYIAQFLLTWGLVSSYKR
jgi:uncharacterized membrane protein YhhN